MVERETNKGTGVGLPIGAKIGKYEVVERCGSGGQAIVYKGYDPLLDRNVAIKQISSHLAEDAKFLERFRKEAQILAKLGAEVITVHDLVEDERGLFIIMEYVEGHSLETVIQDTNGPVETKAALQILWRLAAALHEVHSAGIVHRDLKPGNIIISEHLRPRITDFGVAAGTGGQTSMLLGTTKYMAPEMYGQGTIDARADIYSLGFIMYEMLLGRPRFNEIFEDVVRDKHSEALRWMKWHGNEKVTAPPLHELNPDVPKALSEIIARMIKKDLIERFSSMEELGRSIKSSFSPKARAAAAAGAAEEKLARHGRRAVRRSRTAAGAEELPAGVGDEADELELGPEGPRTAALPKTKLSLRTKLILGGMVAASFIAIVVILVYQTRQADVARAQQAQTVYAEAVAHFKEQNFKKAQKGFEDLQAKRHAGTPQAAKAEVLLPFCRAHLAVLAAQRAQRREDSVAARDLWAKAAEEEEEIKKRNKLLQKRRGDLLAWTQKVAADVKDFGQYRVNARIFAEDITAVRNYFRQVDLAKATEILDDLGDKIELSPEQMGEVKEMRKAIAMAKFKARCDEEISRADALFQHDDVQALKDAAVIYRNVEARMNSDAAKIVPQPQRDQYLLTLKSKLETVEAQRKFHEAMTAAAEALNKGSKGRAVKAYMDARKLAQTQKVRDELDGKISTLRADIAYEQGMWALKSKRPDRFERARRSFERAVGINGHPEAKAQLAEMLKQETRESHIAAARVDYAAGKYAEALKKYEQAAKLGMDEDLSNRMIDCRFQMVFTEAEKLREQKKYTEAEALYKQAGQVKAAEMPRMNAIISAMRTRKQYEEYLAGGDAALKREDYSQAMDQYRKALSVLDTADVRKRMNEVVYQENFSKGKREMDLRNYKGALGYLKIAKRYKETKEVEELIKKVEEILEQSP